MTTWPPYLLRLDALAKADARLAECPDDIEAQFSRARLLAELDRTEEARSSYLEILRRCPAHFGALNNLGTLLYSTGFRSAARIAYGEATARHPDNPMGHVNLANLLRDEGQSEAARTHYETALRLAPNDVEAHRGLALLLLDIGEEGAALIHQRAGFAGRAVTVFPYRGEAAPVPLLLLVSAANGNAPFRKLVDDRVFLVTAIVAEFHDASAALPPHDLLVNAIGDADLCRVALRAAERIVAATTAPVINLPSAVRASGRAGNAARLAALPGVVAPRLLELPREALTQGDAARRVARHGFSYPVLLRSPGYHTGRNFLRIEGEAGLADAAASLPGKELCLIEYLDARGADDMVRKYRVMMIAGELYPAHLAISRHWKVHYFSAGMADDRAYRAEEERFLQNMPEVIGAPAVRALERIRDALALDYGGIDFGLDRAGNVLFFEANAAMTINPPDRDGRWDYRRAPIARILDAARRMLVERARRAA